MRLLAATSAGARALYLLERHEEALGDAERAVSLAADNADYLGTEGHVLAALGRRQDALAAFERARWRLPTPAGSAPTKRR